MHYTIMILDSVLDGQKVKLNKSGNQYLITLYNEEMNESTSKTFDSLTGAMVVFDRFVMAIGSGSYDYNTRKSWLEQ